MRLAIIETSLPPNVAFLVRDLRALIRAGLVLDLYLFNVKALDEVLRREVLATSGTVNRIPLPWSPDALAAFAKELARHPIRLAGTIGMSLGLVLRSPAEGARALAVLPGSLAAGARMTRSGVTQVHGLWAGVPTTVCYWIRRHHGIPYSFSAHAWDLDVRAAWVPRKARAAEGIAICSEWGWRRIEEVLGDHAGGRAHLVHHGLDLDDWKYAPRARPSEPPLILGVGRLMLPKGWDHLVRACALLRDRGHVFRCEIFGGGDSPWVDDLRRLIAGLSLEDCIQLRGSRPSSEVKEAMLRADVLVCPFVQNQSKEGNTRGLANVVPEAMALGTPVISTDAGGLGELVRHGQTGRMVPQRDPEAIADAIADTLRDWSATSRMVRKGREMVEASHDVRRNTEAFLEATGIAHAMTAGRR